MEKTVFVNLKTGATLVFKGKIEPIEYFNLKVEKAITEVVDSITVYTFFLKEE